MEELFSQLGIDHRFVDGESRFSKKRNVAKAMMRAHRSFAAAPYLVCEDDLLLMQEDVVLPPAPADADIIYLAKNHAGCLPDRPDYNSRFGRRSYGGLALAEPHDDHYLRLYSMISAIAILVVSEAGRQRFLVELQKAFNRETAVDVRFAFAMPELRVYTPRMPLFAEDMALQLKANQSEDRRLLTHGQLPIAFEGERRTGEGTFNVVKVIARRNVDTAGLEWEVEDSWPAKGSGTDE
jgi:hypothetical protein